MKRSYEQIVRDWRSPEPQTAEELDDRLQDFRVPFAYHSAKIENDAIPYALMQEVFEQGRVTCFSGAPRMLFEAHNQKMCYFLLLPRIAAGEPISAPLVREMHLTLTAGAYDERRLLRGERPGRYKLHNYVAGPGEVGSSPELVEREMHELLEEMADIGNLEPDKALDAAAYLHARFEHIHPFADGNGRVGRWLVNYFLMTRRHPPLIVFAEDREEYYTALCAYDGNEEIEPLAAFFRWQTVKTWSERERCQ